MVGSGQMFAEDFENKCLMFEMNYKRNVVYLFHLGVELF